MAAIDLFNSFNESLSKREKELVESVRKARLEELLAARSEDARLRLVSDYVQEVHDLLQHQLEKERRR
jgi:hypothetical protein